jgi:ribonuclease J
MTDEAELVFVALGGLGEIGRNCSLYGFGRKGRRKWLMVDLGLSFAGPDVPGVEIVLPDLSFVGRVKQDLVGLIMTHAHEDHIGAVADLWPRLGCPVYASRFAIHLMELKRLAEPGAPIIEIKEIAPNQRILVGPFEVEFIDVAHSIPESMALSIQTPIGRVLHTGDWKIDETPLIGRPTDEQRLRTLGSEGILALVCDSTNVLRDGESPSETDVARTLGDLIRQSPGRVAVTTFASNVARIRAVAEAAAAVGRKVVAVGRAMDRVIDAATDCGYLSGLPEFLSADYFRDLSRDKVVALITGSQGEPRAALRRLAIGEHPDVSLAAGDRVIFSSRTIPGNEKAVGEIVNALVTQGVEVITDRTHLVHVSGHPRRAELAKLYAWTKPKIAIPAHGEALHLFEHAVFARAQGVPHVVSARNGDVVAIGPGQPGIVDEAIHGCLYKDGEILVSAEDEAIAIRRRLAFSGAVSIALAITGRGEIAGDPDVLLSGVPAQGRDGRSMDEVVDEAIFATLDGLPKALRRDSDRTATAVERAVRAAVAAVWGKKPTVHVLVVEV